MKHLQYFKQSPLDDGQRLMISRCGACTTPDHRLHREAEPRCVRLKVPPRTEEAPKKLQKPDLPDLGLKLRHGP